MKGVFREILSPMPYRVCQRSHRSTADIEVSGTLGGERCAGVEFRLLGKGSPDADWRSAEFQGECFTGAVRDVPAGGPYNLELRARDESGEVAARRRVPGLAVGDLWILAGQSNMDGRGKLVNLEPPCRMVHAFYYDETWGVARDPICLPNESVDPVHWQVQDAAERAKLNRRDRAFGDTGAGLGVRFGRDLYKATGVPVGLLMCSHGGTSLAQWSPELKSRGGGSLYGSMLRRVGAVGGRVAGCLWYQGESDALGETGGVGYKERFRRFIESMRADLNSPNLPFIYAQIGPYFGDDPASGIGWNRVQADQLALESEMESILMVATIGSTLSDAIHLDAVSLRRLGARMALLARRLRFGETDIQTDPRPLECSFDDKARSRLRVEFRGVNGSLRPASGIRGFTVEAAGQLREIRKCTLDPADRRSVVIMLAEPAPRGSLLWHGRGLNPACNLADEAGFPAPVFGPVELP